jgi:hypothetical protein
MERLVGTFSVYPAMLMVVRNLSETILVSEQAAFDTSSAAPNSLLFDCEDRRWAGTDVCANLQHTNLTFERIDGLQGLPTRNISVGAVSHFSRSVWFGTKEGVIRYQRQEPGTPDYEYQWRYMYGPRWLPSENMSEGQKVLSIASNLIEVRYPFNEKYCKAGIL